jgi:Holliday junction DNA helicase RuvA
MIASLTGTLRHVQEDRIHLAVGPIVYELFIPASDVQLLEAALGNELTFHTLMYLQGDASGGNIEPRLIGFLRLTDKRFFEKFITVKGIGPRKALRALALPVGEIAQAIEMKDARALTSLPEVGKRTAEQIVAELSGKVKEFATFVEPAKTRGTAGGLQRRSQGEEDAIATLMALGDRRADAEALLDRVKSATPGLQSTDDLVREMLRMRTVRA